MLFGTAKLATLLLAVFALVLPLGAQSDPPSRSFIVVLNDGAGPPDWVAEEVALHHGGRVGYVYEHALKGFSISLPLSAVQSVANRPDVAFIERDLPVSIVAQAMPTGIDRSFASSNPNLDIDSTDDYRVDADVAVLDTGIDLEHTDLYVVGGANCLQSSGGGPPWMRTYYCDPDVSADDDHYHGTHVAGTVGAIDNGFGVVGVAPGVRLWAVKVLDSNGSGYTSGIVAGIDWVVANGTIEVLNMSLGGSGVSEAYQTAIDNAVASGVVVVVAAGNSDDDANNYSPAYVESAITVSALADFDGLEGGLGAETCRSDQDDTLADFSNWGSAIDIAAPGVCILSTYPIEHGEYGTISGTSMAAPHVAGAAALLASGANAPVDGADVQAIRDTLVNTGNYNWVDDSGDGIHEPLLDVSDTTVYAPTLVAGGGGGGSGNEAPTASYSYSCTDLSCDFDASGSSDSDGSITGYDWDFGDGNTGSGVTVSHTYATDGSYSVTLTVTDDDGSTDSSTQTVSVSTATDDGISLSATGYKEKGLHKVDLIWSGATSTDMDVYRDGGLLVTTANDGAYTDHIDQRGGAQYTYQICEAGTSTCSAEVTVTF